MLVFIAYLLEVISGHILAAKASFVNSLTFLEFHYTEGDEIKVNPRIIQIYSVSAKNQFPIVNIVSGN